MLAKNWFRIVCAVLFLCCVGGLVFAITLGHVGFIVTMVALSGIFGMVVYTDWKRLQAPK